MSRNKTNDEIEVDLLVTNMRDVLKTNAGKEVLYAILGMCRIYENNFINDNTAFFLDGKRSVGLELIDLIEEAGMTAYPELLLYKAKQEEGKNNG